MAPLRISSAVSVTRPVSWGLAAGFCAGDSSAALLHPATSKTIASRRGERDTNDLIRFLPIKNVSRRSPCRYLLERFTVSRQLRVPGAPAPPTVRSAPARSRRESGVVHAEHPALPTGLR